MNAVEALRLAQENGIRLGVAGADLILDAEREPAPAVLEAIRRNKVEIVGLLVANHDEWVAEDWRAYFDERAGIAEFDGGQCHGDAEALAFDSCVMERLSRDSMYSSSAHCLGAGKRAQAYSSLLPLEAEMEGGLPRADAEALASLCLPELAAEAGIDDAMIARVIDLGARRLDRLQKRGEL
jgi:hypothetical protein